MALDLTVLYYTGILVPTGITIIIFVIFLLCWFKCSCGHVTSKKSHKDQGSAMLPTQQRTGKPEDDKDSQHSADSAIDVRDVELNVGVDTDVTAPTSVAQVIPEKFGSGNKSCGVTNLGFDESKQLAREMSPVSQGTYPSYEKLNDEIHSEPRIYERQEDIERALYEGLAPTLSSQQQQHHQYNSSRQRLTQLLPSWWKSSASSHQQRATMYHSAPRISHCEVSLTAMPASTSRTPTGARYAGDNRLTDYGFITWSRRPQSNVSIATTQGAVSNNERMRSQIIPAAIHKQQRQQQRQLEWIPNIRGSCSDNYSMEILHV